MTAAAFEVAEVQESKTGSEQNLSNTTEHVLHSQVVMLKRAKWADSVATVDCSSLNDHNSISFKFGQSWPLTT